LCAIFPTTWSPGSRRGLRARVNRSSRELRDILIDAARPPREEILADMDRIRALTPKGPQTDSAELIREDRDRGWR
jgi:hypothetical protein